jgi:hypothetical protein
VSPVSFFTTRKLISSLGCGWVMWMRWCRESRRYRSGAQSRSGEAWISDSEYVVHRFLDGLSCVLVCALTMLRL